jgi:hypothetical protein
LGIVMGNPPGWLNYTREWENSAGVDHQRRLPATIRLTAVRRRPMPKTESVATKTRSADFALRVGFSVGDDQAVTASIPSPN